MFKFTKLNEWCLTGTNPAFYDTESATAVEQTAKIYGSMKTLINETEKAVNTLYKSIEEFKTGINGNQEEFENHITKIMHDYIHMIDEKIKMLDSEVASQISDFINQAIEEGKIVITTAYDETNENLNIVGGA